MFGAGSIPKNVRSVSSSVKALKDADIVFTATIFITPVIYSKNLKTGAHVNAVGSFQPTMQEIDSETIRYTIVVVNSHQSTLIETGDIVTTIEQGLIPSKHIHTELGEIITATKHGRSSQDQLTFFKSYGVVVQDEMITAIILKNVEHENLGTIANL